MWLVSVVLQNNIQVFKTLYDNYKDKDFLVIGVPSNQFGGQEPGLMKK